MHLKLNKLNLVQTDNTLISTGEALQKIQVIVVLKYKYAILSKLGRIVTLSRNPALLFDFSLNYLS